MTRWHIIAGEYVAYQCRPGKARPTGYHVWRGEVGGWRAEERDADAAAVSLGDDFDSDTAAMAAAELRAAGGAS